MRLKTVMLVIAVSCVCILYVLFSRKSVKSLRKVKVHDVENFPVFIGKLNHYEKNCTFHSCFNVLNCQSLTLNKISVGIHPVDEVLTREHISIIKGVKESIFFTDQYLTACVTILPYIHGREINSSIFNRVHLRKDSDSRSNYLIFDLFPRRGSLRRLAIGGAMIASGGLTQEMFRHSYDVAIPVFNPLTAHLHLKQEKRSRLLVVAQVAIPSKLRQQLQNFARARPDDVVVLDRCPGDRSFFRRCTTDGRVFEYPQILKSAKFCGIVASNQALEQSVLFDAMKAGCIPVFLGKTYALPFAEVLDWKRCSLHFPKVSMRRISKFLANVAPGERLYLRRHLRHFFQSYMSSARKIAMTTLHILNDRAVPHAARTHSEWNDPPSVRRQMPLAPLFYPLVVPVNAGFTAVVLTYNRFPELVRLLRRLAPTPSLKHIVVVWNNPEVAPPPVSEWPVLGKSVTIMRSLRNSLNNRFTPFAEITTEAVLTMDDDLDMLTTDELEFAFRIWAHNSDRLVGIPSRLHYRDNVTGAWRYDSEWKSELSMVLTGAAFYHKYYGHLYRTRMPPEVTHYVDAKMMCEDIAMNFLVAHLTGKAALKVTPRKKFRCPSCVNSSASVRTVRRLRERSHCVTSFARHFGPQAPMRVVDFRLDPLLMGVSGPPPVNTFRDVGRL